jgi:hypothetical protein
LYIARISSFFTRSLARCFSRNSLENGERDDGGAASRASPTRCVSRPARRGAAPRAGADFAARAPSCDAGPGKLLIGGAGAGFAGAATATGAAGFASGAFGAGAATAAFGGDGFGALAAIVRDAGFAAAFTLFGTLFAALRTALFFAGAGFVTFFAGLFFTPLFLVTLVFAACFFLELGAADFDADPFFAGFAALFVRDFETLVRATLRLLVRSGLAPSGDPFYNVGR